MPRVSRRSVMRGGGEKRYCTTSISPTPAAIVILFSEKGHCGLSSCPRKCRVGMLPDAAAAILVLTVNRSHCLTFNHLNICRLPFDAAIVVK